MKSAATGKEQIAMSKRARQYIGILAAVIAYYLVHEGAHLLYALFTGAFRIVSLSDSRT